MKRATVILLLFFIVLSPFEAHSEPFLEYYLLQKNKDILQQNENGFSLTLRSGKKIQLQNCLRNCKDASKRYQLSDIIDDRYVIFDVSHYEWQTFDIYDLHSGNMLQTRSYPNFSPDFTRIAAMGASDMNGYWFNVYELKNGTFQEIYSHDNNAYVFPKFYTWINNNKALIVGDEFRHKDKVNMVLSRDSKSNQWSYTKASHTLKTKAPYPYYKSLIKRFPDLKNYFNDQELVITLFKKSSSDARYVNTTLRDNKKVMMAAITSRFDNIKYASNRLKDDADFMHFAIKKSWRAFTFVSNRLKDDSNFMYSALKESSHAFTFASKRLRYDRNFVMAALANNNVKILAFTSDDIKDDEDILKTIIAKNPRAFLDSSQRIQNKTKSNIAFAEELIGINCNVFSFLPEKLRDNKLLLLTAYNGSCNGTFKKASHRLRDDASIVEKFVMQNPRFASFLLEKASLRIRQDEALLLSLAKKGAIIGAIATRDANHSKEFLEELEKLNKINRDSYRKKPRLIQSNRKKQK